MTLILGKQGRMVDRKPYHSPKFTQIEIVDAHLKIWASRTNGLTDIRKMTGCGAGPINEAGPQSSLGKHIVAKNGNVHDSEPIPAVSYQYIMEIDAAVNNLNLDQKKVVLLEYKTDGRQSDKARRENLYLPNYQTILRRARLRVARELNIGIDT